MKRNALAAVMGFVSKFALTDAVPVIVRQLAAFTGVPLQPVNIWPGAGEAVRHTVVPEA